TRFSRDWSSDVCSSDLCPANVNLFEGYNLPHTNYGGQTKVLTASATVVPFQAYEIKLVVADQGDYAWDSAIFIEAGSFNIGLNKIGRASCRERGVKVGM